MTDIESEGFESKTQVEKMIEELKSANVNFENYKEYVGKIRNTTGIIGAQIESLIREYRNLKRKLDEEQEGKRYKASLEEGFVPKAVFELEEDLLVILRDAYSWRALEIQMHNLIFGKISQVLDDAKALDIKRDALREMREMETKRNELHLEMSQGMGEKFLEAVRFLVKENHASQKDLLHSLKDLFPEAVPVPVKEPVLPEKFSEPLVKRKVVAEVAPVARADVFDEPEEEAPASSEPVAEEDYDALERNSDEDADEHEFRPKGGKKK